MCGDASATDRAPQRRFETQAMCPKLAQRTCLTSCWGGVSSARTKAYRPASRRDLRHGSGSKRIRACLAHPPPRGQPKSQMERRCTLTLTVRPSAPWRHRPFLKEGDAIGHNQTLACRVDDLAASHVHSPPRASAARPRRSVALDSSAPGPRGKRMLKADPSAALRCTARVQPRARSTGDWAPRQERCLRPCHRAPTWAPCRVRHRQR
jgi:hypothetical protein